MWPLVAIALAVGALVTLGALLVVLESDGKLRVLAVMSALVFAALSTLFDVSDPRLQTALAAGTASLPLVMVVWDAVYVRGLRANRAWAWRFTKLEFLSIPVLILVLIAVFVATSDR